MGTSSSLQRDNQSTLDLVFSVLRPIAPDCVRALRLVDYSDYIPWKHSPRDADLPFQKLNIKILNRCVFIYSLKHFDIKPGLRFLSIGSGYGYLNTIVGLILGYSGTNHGVEVNGRHIQSALECLQNCLNKTDAPLERDFCIPQFIEGNIFNLFDSVSEDNSSHSSESDSDHVLDDQDTQNPVFPQSWFKRAGFIKDENVQLFYVSIGPPPLYHHGTSSNPDPAGSRWLMYDRIFVSASVRNRKQLKSILRLLAIGGILIAPVRQQLVKITRFGVDLISWRDLFLIPVHPIQSPIGPAPAILPPVTEVSTLLRLAGRAIRLILRRRIEQQHNGLPILGPKHIKTQGKLRVRQNSTNQLMTATLSEVNTPGLLSCSYSEAAPPQNVSRFSCNVSYDSVTQMYESDSSYPNGKIDLGATDGRLPIADMGDIRSIGTSDQNLSLDDSVARYGVAGGGVNKGVTEDFDHSAHPTRKLFDHPASYFYRDEMAAILSKELHLPDSLIRATFVL